jgi:hypothetical protein
MNKGILITGIVDGVANIAIAYTRVAKKAKEDGLVTEKENAYISSVFTEWIKEGNQYVEKVKEMLSPKLAMSEEDKLKLLGQMHEATTKYAMTVKKFEKGFTALLEQRRKKLTDTEEVQRLFKLK